MRRIGSRSNIYTNVSQPLRSLPALGYEPTVCRASLYLSQSEKSSTGFLTSVSETIALLSLSSPSPSASHMQVSGSPSCVARTKRIYPAVSSPLSDHGV